MKTSFQYSYEVKVNALRKIRNRAMFQTLILGGAFIGMLIVFHLLFCDQPVHNSALFCTLFGWVICNINIFKTYFKESKRVDSGFSK